LFQIYLGGVQVASLLFNTQNMELGRIQKEWVKSLREHPERQMSDFLGKVVDRDEYKACCLGELLCVRARLENKPPPFVYGSIWDGDNSSSLTSSYGGLGLRSNNGGFEIDEEIRIFMKDSRIEKTDSLASLNDSGVKWPIIADFVEAFPDKIFTKSV